MRSSPFALLKRLELRRFVGLISHLPSFVKLFSRLVNDARISLWPKLLLLLVLAYVIVPTDLVPDFLFGLGQVDDLVIVFAGLRLFLRLCPKEVVQEHVRTIASGR